MRLNYHKTGFLVQASYISHSHIGRTMLTDMTVQGKRTATEYFVGSYCTQYGFCNLILIILGRFRYDNQLTIAIT